MNWYKQTSRFPKMQDDLNNQIDEAVNILYNIVTKGTDKSIEESTHNPFYIFYIKSSYLSKIIVDPIPVQAYFRNRSDKNPATLITNLPHVLDRFKDPNNLRIIEGDKEHILHNEITSEKQKFVAYVSVNLNDKRGQGVYERDLKIYLYHELVHMGDPVAMIEKIPGTDSRSVDTSTGDFRKKYFNNPSEINAYSAALANSLQLELNELDDYDSKIMYLDNVLEMAREGDLEEIFATVSNNAIPPYYWSEENRRMFLSRLYNLVIDIKQNLISETQASGKSWYKLSELEIIDDRSRDEYRNIAHDLFYRTEKARINNPNYLWVYIDDVIETNPETMGKPSHLHYWGSIDYEKTFAGRYSPSTKTITVVRPLGVYQFKEIPSHIKLMLSQQFPEAEKLSIHASANNWYKLAQIALTFEYDDENVHHEQSDHTLIAIDATTKQPVGAIMYAVFRGQVHINNILVLNELKRKGIATQMMEELKREYNTRINWGMMTPDGSALYDSMDNPENV